MILGITLTEKDPVEMWDPEGPKDFNRTHKLIIKQILLGSEAASDEYNVVQVQTMGMRDTLRIPIAVLKVGETRSVRPDLEFPDSPVTFKLIEGKGPVHIHGQHLLGSFGEEYDMEEMEDEFLDEEEQVIIDLSHIYLLSNTNYVFHQEGDLEDDEIPKKKPKLSNSGNNTKGVSGGGSKPVVVGSSSNKNNKKK